MSPCIFWHQKRVILLYFLSFIVSDCSVSLELIGNGFCNDEANNVGCNFDNGDCCGTCINTDYCLLCECLSEEPGNGISNALFANCNSKYFCLNEI